MNMIKEENIRGRSVVYRKKLGLQTIELQFITYKKKTLAIYGAQNMG